MDTIRVRAPKMEILVEIGPAVQLGLGDCVLSPAAVDARHPRRRRRLSARKDRVPLDTRPARRPASAVEIGLLLAQARGCLVWVPLAIGAVYLGRKSDYGGESVGRGGLWRHGVRDAGDTKRPWRILQEGLGVPGSDRKRHGAVPGQPCAPLSTVHPAGPPGHPLHSAEEAL